MGHRKKEGNEKRGLSYIGGSGEEEGGKEGEEGQI